MIGNERGPRARYSLRSGCTGKGCCLWCCDNSSPYFFAYPSVGLGMFGRQSPEGIRAVLSPLANHCFYGVGLAVGVALM